MAAMNDDHGKHDHDDHDHHDHDHHNDHDHDHGHAPGPDAGSEALIEFHRHEHAFLGQNHDRNARKTWWVVGLCTVMMVVEIGGGLMFRSMALTADGVHMATHAGAMIIAAGAYMMARRRQSDPRFSFGTGKFGDLSAFTSAIILLATAVGVAIESASRLFKPEAIAFDQAIPIAVVGLLVNIASAWLLADDHDHHHGHDHGHHHADHGHEHDDHDHHDHKHHDLNLRAAYVHVAADAAVSVLAIIGLVAGRQFGWLWLDPVMGLVGAFVIGKWALGLIRAAGAILLDMNPDPSLGDRIVKRLGLEGDVVCDFHLWRVGPGHNAAIAKIVTKRDAGPAEFKRRLAGLPTLSHITIEVERVS